MTETRPISTAIIIFAFCAGCSNSSNTVPEPPKTNLEEDAIKSAVVKTLNDPASAIFGKINITEGTKGKYACATVNAKNAFGGYTGDQQMMVQHYDTSGWVGISILQQHHGACMDSARNLAGSKPLW